MTQNTQSSLVIFTQATRMLAEATTIQKAKDLKDLALTAADFAKHKGMGEEAVQYARSYALEAERRMGELLKETERAKGAAVPGVGKRGAQGEPRCEDEPTLAVLGLSKKESAAAQRLAEMPNEVRPT